MSSDIDNVHDKQFFAALRNLDIARDAIQAHLPPALLAQLNLQAMRLYHTKLVSPQMKEFEADVFYEIPFQNSTALLLFHAEQESKPRRIMPLKVWQYLFLVLMEYAENHPKQPLPVPLPIIVYTGEQPFKYSTYLFDLFGEQKSLAESLFYQDIPLIDVCRMSDDDIKKHRLFGLSEYIFKHKADKQFADSLPTIIDWLSEMERHGFTQYAKMVIGYVIHAFSNADITIFANAISLHLSKELGDQAMTMAEQLRQQGMQAGMQAGMQQGMNAKTREIAMNLLRAHIAPEIIAETTHLSQDEIKKLLTEVENTKH